MIVLDESIYDERLATSILRWYPGTVTSIVKLRPSTLVKDEAIPMLLRRVSQPTFLTINVDDFWLKVAAQPSYCIVAVPLRQHESLFAADWLRRCLRLPQFRTKASRMGKVILLRPTHIEYYESNRQIIELEWSESASQ